MWYRVEVGDDNEILSCVETADVARSGRRVYYVEADSKEGAVIAAKRWAEMRSKDLIRQRERRAEQRASGKCQHGRCQYAPESGKLYCPAHLKELRDRANAYNAGVRIRPVRTDAEKYQHALANNRPAARKLRTLEEVLAAYRREPDFEVWLTKRIRELQCQLNRELIAEVARRAS